MAKQSLIRLLIALVISLALLASCSAPASMPTPSAPASSSVEIAPPTSTTTSPAQTVIPSNTIEALVTRVIDGDTIEVNIDGILYKVRYIGIDTPETVDPSKPTQPFGLEASAKNKELVGGKTVKLEKDVSETDKYGRLLRYVYVGNLFINAEMVRLGYAQVTTYPPDVKYQDLFLQLQREAREASRGLWGTSTTSDTTSTGKYVGSAKSDKYHYPTCTYAKQISPENLVWFNSAADAQSKGYVPCGVCKPPTTD